jgi:predicted HicB family RNase H-like nuclease
MDYQGYVAKVDFDDEARVFHGEVINLRDVVTFEADSVEALVKAFHDSAHDYLEFCAQRGEQPEKPFSGKLLVRLPPDLHRTLSVHARLSKVSLNAYIAGVLETAVMDDRRHKRS